MPNALNNPTVDKSSITEAAYRRLRADLMACRLMPGERLRINLLSNSLGVSSGAVREALSRLTSEGFVVAEPQRGFRAAPISRKDLVDLTEARIAVESLCVRRSIAAGDVAWETRLVAAAHQLSRTPMQAVEDGRRVSDVWNVAHDQYHEALVSACDNRTFLQLRRQLFAQAERYRLLSVPLADSGRDTQGEHRAIVQAALNRNDDRAAKLLAEHVTETTRILLRFLDKHFSANSVSKTACVEV